MENSQLYLNKIMLNITTSKEQGLNFTKGEVLRGMVQDVKANDLVSLFIKGQIIDAVSEVPVKPGQQLQLMVEDFREGRAYLKILTPQLMERIENSNISLNLSEIGVPAKEENIIIARKLLHYRLPVTSDNLNILSKAMLILGGTNSKNAEIAAFSMARGLPLDAPGLKSLAQFLTTANDLGKLAGNLEKGLLQLEQVVNRMVETGRASSWRIEGMEKEVILRSGASSDKFIEDKNFPAITKKGGGALLQTSGKGPEIQGITTPRSGELPSFTEGKPVSGQPVYGTGENTINSIEKDIGKVKLQALFAGNMDDKKQLAESTKARLNVSIAHENASGTRQATALDSPRSMSADTIIKPQVTVTPKNSIGDMSEPTKSLSGRDAAFLDSSGGKATPGAPNPFQSTGLQEEAAANKQAFVANQPPTAGKIADVSASVLPGEAPNKTQAPGVISMNSAGLTTPGADRSLPEQREVLRYISLLKTILGILNPNLGGDSQEIRNRLQNVVGQEREIIRVLGLLQEIIKSDSGMMKNPLLTDILNKIEGMEKELSAQRMLNVYSRGATDSNINYLYFAFPVKWGDEYRLGQLKINRDMGRKDLNKQDSIKFIVSLDTAQMGAVLFHVNWKKCGELEVQGVVEQAEIREYLNRNLGELFRGLKDLGYRVKNLGIKVLEREEEMRLRLAFGETPLTVRPFGIDIRV